MSLNEMVESLVPQKPFLVRGELAELLDMQVQTLANLATDRKGPSFVRLGRSVRYPRPAVIAWLMQNAAAIPTQL